MTAGEPESPTISAGGDAVVIVPVGLAQTRRVMAGGNAVIVVYDEGMDAASIRAAIETAAQQSARRRERGVA